MSWSTELFCNISFNRETYNSKEQVKETIKEFELYLQNSKDHLRNILMMTEPEKFCPENYDVVIWLRNEFQDSLSDIEEYTTELYKLNLLLTNWNACHTKEGLAINHPEKIDYKTAFLDGKFVNTIEHPYASELEKIPKSLEIFK